MRHIHPRLLLGCCVWSLVAVLSSSTGSARGQDEKKMTGVWKLEFKRPDGKMAQRVLYLIQDGTKLMVKDSPKGKTLVGSVEDGKVKIPLLIMLDKDDKKEVTFTGSFEEKKLKGSATIQDQKIKWTGAILLSVWVCDNHDPIHTATTDKQIKALTKKYKCSGWQRLGSEDAALLMHGRKSKEKKKE
jgi:hypothetical protein